MSGRPGPCRHCGRPLLYDDEGRPVHTDLSYVCRDRWGQVTDTYAEPAIDVETFVADDPAGDHERPAEGTSGMGTSKSRWIRWLGLPVLLIVGLACNGEGADKPNTAKLCDTRIIQRPTAVKVHTQVVVRTETKSECDKAPAAHVVHISMDGRAFSFALPEKPTSTIRKC